MNKKSMAMLCILFLVSFVVSSCRPNGDGINTPIVIEGIDLLINDVKTIDAIIGKLTFNPSTSSFDAEKIKPEAPYDVWIIVDITTEYSGSKDPCNWRGDNGIILEFEKDTQKASSNFDLCSTDYSEDYVRLYYVGYTKGVSNYELVFPNGQRIPLDTLMD